MLNSPIDILLYVFSILLIGFIGGAILSTVYDTIMEKRYPQKFKEENTQKKSNHRTIIAALIVASLYTGYSIMKDFWGTKTIGSFAELNKYETQYYVNLFPENDKSKNYRLKADIVADFYEWEETNNNGDSTTSSKRVYWLKKVYFDNGGFLTFQNSFDDCDDSNSLELNHKVSLRDNSDKYWDVELTNIKAN